MNAHAIRKRTIAGRRRILDVVIAVLLLAGCDRLQPPAAIDDEPEPPAQAASPPPVDVTPEVPRTPEVIIDEFLAVQPQRRTDDQLLELSGLDEGLDRITELNLSGSSVTDDGVAALVEFGALTNLDISGTRATPACVQYLVGIAGLEELSLDRLPVNDESLAVLSELPSLRSLSLRSTAITDNCFAHLAACETLETLRIGSNELLVGREFTELLSRGEFSTLRELSVSGTAFGYGGLDALNRLSQLEVLRASSADVTDANLDAIGACTNLRTLTLSDNLLTNAGIQQLTRLGNLEELDLGNCRLIGDDALQLLRRHSQLQRLSLQGSNCTLAGAMELKEKFLEDTTIIIANEEL